MVQQPKRDVPRTQPQEPVISGSEISDKILISAIADKAVWAMEVLYERYHRMLYALVYRMLADHQVTEDILQEAFFSVWQKAASYAPASGEVRSWIIAIVHHRAIDYLRGVQRRAAFQQMPLEQVDLAENASFPDVWDEAWQSVQRDVIRQALLHLPQEQRLVIELAYFQGWTQSEIAQGIRVPLGTVKARMRLGLLHLKQFLEHTQIHEAEEDPSPQHFPENE